MFLPALSSCSPGGPEERLTAYCIRECVIYTSDPDICDTRCDCAVDKLSAEMSRRDFLSMVNKITKNDNPAHEYAPQLRMSWIGVKL